MLLVSLGGWNFREGWGGRDWGPKGGPNRTLAHFLICILLWREPFGYFEINCILNSHSLAVYQSIETWNYLVVLLLLGVKGYSRAKAHL